MSKIFENSPFINKLSKNDPESIFVNKMMEMSPSILRDLHSNGETHDSMHGVVPTMRLPNGYNYGNFSTILKNQKDYNGNVKIKNHIDDYMNNNTTLHGENNSIINDSLSSTSNNSDNCQLVFDILNDCSKKLPNLKQINVFQKHYTVNKEKIKLNVEDEIFQGDILMSNNDEDNLSHISNNSDDNGKLLFETLNACLKKLPKINYFKTFQKHYTGNKSQIQPKTNNENEMELELNPHSDIELLEDNKRNLMEILSKCSNNNQLKSFYPIYNLIKDRKRKLELLKTDEKDVIVGKLIILSEKSENKKDVLSDFNYKIYSRNNDSVLTINVIPNSSYIDFDKLRNIIKSKSELSKKEHYTENYTKTTENLQLCNNENSIQNNNKKVEDNLIVAVAPQSSLNNIFIETIDNQITKPEIVLKPFNVETTNNHQKVEVVTENTNKVQNNLKSNPNINAARSTQNSSRLSIAQGLLDIEKRRVYLKNDFTERTRNLDITKWSTEVLSLKEKATNSIKKLDYAPQIMIFLRKNLFFNYFLELKKDHRKSHKTYLENAKIIMKSCYEITQTYSEHENSISDNNSARLWNIKLVKHFTVVLCHKLSAILRYRAFRNVHENCRRTHDMLVKNGIINRNSSPAQLLLTESNQQVLNSPLSIHSSKEYCQISTNISSPQLCTTVDNNSDIISYNNSISTMTQDLKLQLQKYMDHSNIINTAYSDWLLAETYLGNFCSRSAKHQDSWKDFEFKIVEMSGGIKIDCINESIPFIIKYIEGYINHMNEFMKKNL